MKIQLLSFEDCPNVDKARATLRQAMLETGTREPIEEIDIGREDAPAWSRAWGSPTILIDGDDVTGTTRPSGDIGCRLYAGGAPSVDQIRERLRIAGASPATGEIATLAGQKPGAR